MGKSKDFSSLGNTINRKASTTSNPEPKADAPKTKAMTLKLSEADYDRLRSYAFTHKLSHQAVMEAALLDYLDSHE